MAKRLMTGTTCGNGSIITFIADDSNLGASPLTKIFQSNEGICFTLTATGSTTTSDSTLGIFFGPYSSCTVCLTPDNSGGITSTDCKNCGTDSFTSSTFNQAVYTDLQGRSVRQNNSVSLGGFNGLNN